MKAIKNEFSAVAQLLNRSSLSSTPNHILVRNINASLALCEKQQSTENSESNKNDAPKPSSDEANKEPNKDKNQSSGKDGKSKKEKLEDKDRINRMNRGLAMMTKVLLWVCLIYSISFTVYVVTSILNGGTGSLENSENYIVSWKEFVQYMLAAGEVREIIIRPDYDHVRISLHNGAIINGRRPRYSSYLLTVPDTEKLEQRLREVEKKLGVVEGKFFFVSSPSSLFMDFL